MKPPSPTLAQKLAAAYIEIQDSHGISNMTRNERRAPRGKQLIQLARIEYLERENEILMAEIEGRNY